ncbi:6873_t:CDS:2, partial [Ambispora leptoticha]
MDYSHYTRRKRRMKQRENLEMARHSYSQLKASNREKSTTNTKQLEFMKQDNLKRRRDNEDEDLLATSRRKGEVVVDDDDEIDQEAYSLLYNDENIEKIMEFVDENYLSEENKLPDASNSE